MHTIAIFDDSHSAESVIDLLRAEHIPTELVSHSDPNGQFIYLIRAEDAEAAAASKKIHQFNRNSMIKCPQCASPSIDFPATPNHSMMAKAAGQLAQKAGLVSPHFICNNCQHEWQ